MSEVTKTFTFFAEETESGGFLFRFFFFEGTETEVGLFPVPGVLRQVRRRRKRRLTTPTCRRKEGKIRRS